jgi:radical SAM protein with 4Fe4S-binding SPASM domain
MCGRRKLERDYPDKLNFGDIDLEVIYLLSEQIPDNILIQFHNNGEPLLYPYLNQALGMFKKQIRCMDTNGKLLLDKADEIIDNIDTLTISVIENDDEGDKQYEIVKKFIEIKGDKKPRLIYRLLGDVSKTPHNIVIASVYVKEKIERWYKLPGIVATRILHHPLGSFQYECSPTVPEHGICLDLLSHLIIDRYGDVYPCVRFNPNQYNKLGNVKEDKLIDLWNSDYRQKMLQLHIEGKRKELPLCNTCEFYGIPRGK